MMLCGCGEDAPPLKSNSYTPPNFKGNEPAASAPVQPTNTKPPYSKTYRPEATPPVRTSNTPGATYQSTQRPASPERNLNNTARNLNPEVIDGTSTAVDSGDGATPPTFITADNSTSDLLEFTDKDMQIAATVNIRSKDVVNEHSFGVSSSGKTRFISKSTPRPQANRLEKTWDTSAPLEEPVPVSNLSSINVVPKVIADYKLAEYCISSKVLDSIVGKTITVTGMVLQVNKTERGPKLEMFKSRILCFPKDRTDMSFNNISNFYETGLKIQENRSDRYIGFLIKATVRGTVKRGVKIDSIEIVDSEVLAWYGVEVLIGVYSTELGSVCKQEYEGTRIRYRAQGKLRFNIVAGFSSPITYYNRQEKEKEVSGFVFQSDETFEGVLIKINPDLEKTVMLKNQLTMDSDPLCLGRELHMINEILHRKGYANKFVLNVDVNPVHTNLFKNGNVTQWASLTEDVGLYPVSVINYANERELLTADNGFPVKYGNK